MDNSPTPAPGTSPEPTPQQGPPVAPWPADATPPAPAGTTPPVAPKKSRAWIGWLIAVVVAMALLVGSCTWMFWAIGDSLGTGGGNPFSSGGFGDAVGVIYLDGVIAGTGGVDYITPDAFISALHDAEDDESVKAILLRVDSPGGTVAASEEIAAAVKSCSKPVVVSVGDICASGAYMVSSQSDKIVAMPGSSVGSIGVILEIPNVEGLLDKLGVKFTVITAGKYKDAGSPYRELTPEEVKMLQQEVDTVYGQFIDIVADGRDMKRSEVEKLANGWAWPGTTAKELGLIDQIGGYDDALKVAAKLGGIQGEPDVIDFPLYQPGQLIDELLGLQARYGLKLPGLDSEEAIRKALPR